MYPYQLTSLLTPVPDEGVLGVFVLPEDAAAHLGLAKPLMFPLPTDSTLRATASPLLPSIVVIFPLETDSTTPMWSE